MNAIFADTYYFLALTNVKDVAHVRALSASASANVHILTTEWVLTELADALSSPSERPNFRRIYQTLTSDPLTTLVPASHSLFEQGLDLFFHRPDKDWSLTDCISFVVMKDHGLTEALTADKHFQQAGYIPLLLNR